MGWSRYLWSAVGGLLLAVGFPKFGLAGLSWVGPGCILFAALGRPGGEAFRIGYVGGLVSTLVWLHWLLFIPFPAGAIAGWLALSAYVALFPAAWVWFCWRVFPGMEAGEGPGFLQVSLPRRVVWAFVCAVAWVALEMILARLFSGFPWNLLGVSQYLILPLIQISAFTGVYGVSFLMAWFSVALASAAFSLVAFPTRSKAWVGDLILPLVAVLAAVAYGSTRLAERPAPERTLKAVLIQPSIPQNLIWDTNQNTIRFHQLIDLSERALKQTTNAQLIVWPEAAVPNMLRYDLDTYTAITNLTRQHHVWMILGSDDAVPRRDESALEVDYYNSSFLVDPDGEVRGVYRKRRLVIFGEYIPLERWLPFMKFLTPVGGSFAAGLKPRPFLIADLRVKTSVLICFEDVFPHGVREYVEPDLDFLLNLTNNGWFGESAAQWQHAANAVFRAVENRIPLVRCSNNGLTCWVDTWGGMHDVYFPNSRDIYGAGFKTVDVPLLAPGRERELTFYTRHGDWFGWSCVAAAGAMSARLMLRRRKAARIPPPRPISDPASDTSHG